MELTIILRKHFDFVLNNAIHWSNSNQIMVWSDVENNIINMISLDGTGLVTELVTTDIAAVGK